VAATGLDPVARRELSVRYDARRLRRRYAFLLGIFALAVLFVGGQVASRAGTVANVALSGFFAVLLIPAIVSLAVLTVRWVLPGRSLVDLDPQGVRLPSIGCDPPWSSLAEIRLFPLRYVRRDGQQAMVVAFVPRDPAAALEAIHVGRRRRRRLERSLRVYGTPLSVSDAMISRSGAEIAAVASAHAGAPVRRY